MNSQNPRAIPTSKETQPQALDQRRTVRPKERRVMKASKSGGTVANGNPLAEPVYHSTAALGHQLKNFQSLEFDAEGTVLRTLEESEVARVNFAEKISEAVNISKKETKYTGLISVDVPVEATIAHEVQERIAKVKVSNKQPWQKPSKASDVPAPDIMSFFDPSLIVERPIVDIPTTTSHELRPEPCSPNVAFDLYRHMCSWNT